MVINLYKISPSSDYFYRLKTSRLTPHKKFKLKKKKKEIQIKAKKKTEGIQIK